MRKARLAFQRFALQKIHEEEQHCRFKIHKEFTNVLQLISQVTQKIVVDTEKMKVGDYLIGQRSWKLSSMRSVQQCQLQPQF